MGVAFDPAFEAGVGLETGETIQRSKAGLGLHAKTLQPSG